MDERKRFYIRFATPCGTASRAREKRLRSGYDPKPLRNDESPDGISELPDRDQERVFQANFLYKFVADACKVLSARGILWSVENPKNSLSWATSWMSAMRAGTSCREVHFQHCMHGGTRDKRTMLLVSGDLDLSGLTSECDGKHTHSPWGISSGRGFATAQGRNYPALLCSRWAKLATKHAASVFGPIQSRLKEFQVGVSQKAKGLPDDKLQHVFSRTAASQRPPGIDS